MNDIDVGIQKDEISFSEGFFVEENNIFVRFQPGKSNSALQLYVETLRIPNRTCSKAFTLGIPCIGWFTVGEWDND